MIGMQKYKSNLNREENGKNKKNRPLLLKVFEVYDTKRENFDSPLGGDLEKTVKKMKNQFQRF